MPNLSPVPEIQGSPLAPRISCAVCRRPVDRVSWSDDHDTGERVIRAHCHGDVDEMRVDLRKLTRAQLRALEASQGVAFTTRRIEP